MTAPLEKMDREPKHWELTPRPFAADYSFLSFIIHRFFFFYPYFFFLLSRRPHWIMSLWLYDNHLHLTRIIQWTMLNTTTDYCHLAADSELGCSPPFLLKLSKLFFFFLFTLFFYFCAFSPPRLNARFFSGSTYSMNLAKYHHGIYSRLMPLPTDEWKPLIVIAH